MKKKFYARMCPKCKAINPPVKEFSHTHSGSKCRNIIKKGFLFNTYCNSLNDMDEDSIWIVVQVKECK